MESAYPVSAKASAAVAVNASVRVVASADEVAALLAKLGVRERIRAVMLAHEARMTA